MDEDRPDVMGVDFLLEDLNVFVVERAVSPAPWIACEDLDSLTFSLEGAPDDVLETTGNGYVKT